jgi:hypothetical protein
MAVRERDCLDCKWERTMAGGCWWLGRCCCHVGWGMSACVVSIPVGGWRRGEAVVRRVWCYCEERGCWIWRRKLGIWERLFCVFGFFFFFLLIICVLRGGCESVKGVEYERLKERASVWGCCWLPWSCGAATGVVYSRGCY